MKLRALALVGVMALTACGDTASTTIQAAPGQSVQSIANTIVQTRAISVFIDAVCRQRGVKLRDPNVRASVTKDIRNLQAQGYDIADITRAFERANKNQKALTRNAVTYLEKRGVRKGDIGSVCAVGRKEIADGTAVGRLLRRG